MLRHSKEGPGALMPSKGAKVTREEEREREFFCFQSPTTGFLVFENSGVLSRAHFTTFFSKSLLVPGARVPGCKVGGGGHWAIQTQGVAVFHGHLPLL